MDQRDRAGFGRPVSTLLIGVFLKLLPPIWTSSQRLHSHQDLCNIQQRKAMVYSKTQTPLSGQRGRLQK